MKKLIELTASNKDEANEVIETRIFDVTKPGVFFGSFGGGKYGVTFIAKGSYAEEDYGNLVVIVGEYEEYYTFSEVTSIEGANALYNDLFVLGLSDVIEKYNGSEE